MKGIVPYLNFDGNCRQAMTFYNKCLGGKLELHPFSEMPGDIPPETRDRLMHARVTAGGCEVMASDIMPGMAFQPGTNMTVSVQCESREEIDRLFAALSENAKVGMPLGDQFWGARFGTLTDQFGVQWMFNFEYPKQP